MLWHNIVTAFDKVVSTLCELCSNIAPQHWRLTLQQCLCHVLWALYQQWLHCHIVLACFRSKMIVIQIILLQFCNSKHLDNGTITFTKFIRNTAYHSVGLMGRWWIIKKFPQQIHTPQFECILSMSETHCSTVFEYMFFILKITVLYFLEWLYWPKNNIIIFTN